MAAPVPKEKHFLGRLLRTQQGRLGQQDGARNQTHELGISSSPHYSSDMEQQGKGRKVGGTTSCAAPRPPVFLLSRERVFLEGSPCISSSQKVAWRRGKLSSVSAADERMENSGTCLVATRSAMEESTADSSFLYIIHENRKTEPIISE